MARKRQKLQLSTEHLNQALFKACHSLASAQDIKALIEEGAFAWAQDDAGWTSLHYAAQRQDADLVEYLLKNGAVWNMTDNNGYTAGDMAFSLNNQHIYDLILNEGIRSEVLKRVLGQEEEHPKTAATDNATFLETELIFKGDGEKEVCFDSDGNAVMMGWETELMKETARCLCSDHPSNNDEGLVIVNIGHGLGIIDEELQSYKPRKHVIVEAHPDVLARMKSKGWYDRQGVEVFEGRWQDWLVSNTDLFDIIYWDTFSEHYQDLYEFMDGLINILQENGRASFFHGLGADNRLFYDVYTSVTEYHARDFGLQISFKDVPVRTKDINWEGATYKYWQLGIDYRLPTITM